MADNTAPTTRDLLLDAMFKGQHPDGYWSGGHTEPTDLGLEGALDGLLAAFPALGAVTGTPDRDDESRAKAWRDLLKARGFRNFQGAYPDPDEDFDAGFIDGWNAAVGRVGGEANHDGD